MSKILIVDDERTARKGISFLLRSAVGKIKEAESKEQAESILKQQEFDLAIIDLRLPEEEIGIGLIQYVKQKYPLTPVLVITAFGTVDSAVKAMKAGAEDYLTKDFTKDEIVLKVNRILETRRLNLANLRLSEKVRNLEQKFDSFLQVDQIVGNSQAMEKILKLVNRVGQDNDSTALITGDSGTGKELIARSIHLNSPRRKENKFIIVDVANMPATLLESQLFGHEKGSFTNAHKRHIGMFELADGGTVFLDEIGDFPPGLQVKLLRFLQEKTFSRVGGTQSLSSNVRIIAATNQNLEEMVKDKTFRQDLYYRLNVIRIQLPPLRERLEDIPELIDFFKNKLELQKGRQLIFSKEIISRMLSYSWPGNIRQLKNLMERLFVICPDQVVREEDLYFYDNYEQEKSDNFYHSLFQKPLKEARRLLLEKFEKEFLNRYLKIFDGNISKISKEVGESRESLSKKISRYKLKNE